MAKYIPLHEGEEFGRLTALGKYELREYGHKGARRHYEYFICDCGNKIWVRTDYVKRGHTQSCGCYTKDCVIKRSTKHGGAKRGEHDKLYDIYSCILGRCNDKKNLTYGGRGIKCIWDNYEDFKRDMEDGYLSHTKKYGTENTQIDRIDNDGNYCKENCRRVTRKENCKNRRSNIFVEWEGQKMVLSDVYNKSNSVVKYTTFMYRYHHGWDLEKALYTPVKYNLNNKKE